MLESTATEAPSPGGALSRILTVNTGSSSLKADLYPLASDDEAVLDMRVERIGSAHAVIRVSDGTGTILLDDTRSLSGHDAALAAVLAWLRQNGYAEVVGAVGHRVVHGGPEYTAPQVVTDALIATLRQLVPIDPNHLPQAIAAIEATGRAFPSIPQVACFDTAFHRSMPRVAQIYPLPRRFAENGLIRYGFHGLSYEFVLRQVRSLDHDGANGRLIIAHLGNGASMAAVRDGRGIDTTMGFTPTGGLVMGTRAGDLDPGVILYLLQSQGMSAHAVNDLVNQQAGLLGVSETSSDMQDLLAAAGTDARAAEAVDLFCYTVRKFIGALAASLGGLDMVIFTGGIGEHAAPIRQRICAGLEFLGIRIDSDRNLHHAPIISPDGAAVTIRVIPTDEDRMIADHTRTILQKRGTPHV